jgi:hypothetical protein
MPLPISHTPVLKGADSKRFNAELKKYASSRISRARRAKGISLVQAVMKHLKI